MFELPKSALGIAAAIKSKDVSPVEVVAHYLQKVDERNAPLNAMIWRRDDELKEEAKELEARIRRGDELGPFAGVPIPIKDLTEVNGHPTTHGSRLARHKIGRYDSTAVTSLKKAGFLLMGRTNSPEFGTLPVTENELHGPTRNPWNTARTPGGSSGGAAAAVASGMAPIAHASDGGGSIRIPASCCGLVGLKAARARIPKGPFISETMHGFSTDGCVSLTVDDTAALLDVLAFRDMNAWYGVPPPETPFLDQARRDPPRLRIGYTLHGPIKTPVEPAVAEAVHKAADALRSIGHDVYEAQPDWDKTGEQLAHDFITIWASGSAYLDFPDYSELEELNAGLRAICQKQSTMEYVKAVIRMQLFSRQVVESWGRDFDVLLTPTMAMEPPPIGWIFETGEKDPEKLLWRCTEMVPFTGWANVTGQPAISLPTHVSASGLPVGVQLVGAPYAEGRLLQLGNQLERAIQWVTRLPL